MSELFYPPAPGFKFGAYIRHLREQRQLSMQDVIDASAGKLSLTSLSAIERDRTPSIPSARLLEGLSDALDLPIIYLFTLAYISDKGLDPSSVDRAWEEFDISVPGDKAGRLKVPRFQAEPLGLAAPEVVFYILNRNVRITVEASRLDYVVPGDVIATDARVTPRLGSLMLGMWPEENTLLLYRHGLDTTEVLVQARVAAQAHHVLSSIDRVQERTPVVWRCGRMPS